MAKGKLYLLPVPLGEDTWHTVPEYVVALIHELDAFVVERAKTARHFLKAIAFPKAFDDCLFFELNKRTTPEEILTMYADRIVRGQPVGQHTCHAHVA